MKCFVMLKQTHSLLIITLAMYSVLAPAKAAAATLLIGYAAAGTATDLGPQDGVFDEFAPFNFGSVNNNGYTSFRTALEFDISAMPSGSSVNSATLSMYGYLEGDREIALHGYTGNGTISLADFALDYFLDSTTLSNPGFVLLSFDVSPLVQSVLSNGDLYAGFNIREDPANASNFTVMNLSMPSAELSIDYSSTPNPIPLPGTFGLLGLGLAGIGFMRRKHA